MARKLVGLSTLALDEIPSSCAGCQYWESAPRLERDCGARCDGEAARAWFARVTTEWGECGRAAVDDGVALGFMKYAPPGYFPQSLHMPSGAPLPDVPMIACIHIEPDARGRGLGGVLMKSVLRDLVQRGERTVQVYADASGDRRADNPLIGVDFLLRHGFVIERAHPQVPLLKLELKALVSWTDNLEAVLDSLRLPIRVPGRAPATLAAPKGDL